MRLGYTFTPSRLSLISGVFNSHIYQPGLELLYFNTRLISIESQPKKIVVVVVVVVVVFVFVVTIVGHRNITSKFGKMGSIIIDTLL